jgi:hypothetical protein
VLSGSLDEMCERCVCPVGLCAVHEMVEGGRKISGTSASAVPSFHQSAEIGVCQPVYVTAVPFPPANLCLAFRSYGLLNIEHTLVDIGTHLQLLDCLGILL